MQILERRETLVGTSRFSGCRLVLDLEFGHRPAMIIYLMRMIDGP